MLDLLSHQMSNASVWRLHYGVVELLCFDHRDFLFTLATIVRMFGHAEQVCCCSQLIWSILLGQGSIRFFDLAKQNMLSFAMDVTVIAEFSYRHCV